MMMMMTMIMIEEMVHRADNIVGFIVDVQDNDDWTERIKEKLIEEFLNFKITIENRISLALSPSHSQLIEVYGDDEDDEDEDDLG